MNTIIIKLGGSVITAKRSRESRIEHAAVAAIAKDIAVLRRKSPDVRIVLLHGGGSFGHPLAHRHGLVHGVPTTARLMAAAKTIASMRMLGNQLSEIMWKEGLSVVPLQSSAVVPLERRDGTIERLLEIGAVPMLNGDVVIRNGRTDIMSADEQVVALAKSLKPAMVVFLSDVDGVFRHFPPEKGETFLKKMSRANVGELLRHSKSYPTNTDVTGGMNGKLTQLLGLKKMRVIVCNGNKPHALLRAVNGSVGTLVQL